MQISYKRKFIKVYGKLPVKIQKVCDKRLKIFKNNIYSPILNNYKLTGKYSELNSINITGDYRAIFKQDKNLIIFMILGTHSKLYK